MIPAKRFVVQYRANGLCLLEDRRFDERVQKRVDLSWWVTKLEDATRFANEQMAWQALAKSGCGSPRDYEVVPV